jgi:ABC-2 type transport system ATP-binding protein
MIVLSTKNLTKTFNDKEVVKNVSFEIEEQTITGIIGRNGCGKTVLLKMLAGLYIPTSGSINYHGFEVIKDYGVLIDTGFLDNESGFNNLKLLAILKNELNDDQIKEIMNYVKLDPYNKTKYKNYSTGMKQKLKLAQAIMENPQILILDEPFNGLDKESVKFFREKLKELKNAGKTIILTSHYEEDIKALCDKVYEMEDGELKDFKNF